MRYAYRHLFGAPDGYLIRLRCWALGHLWLTCVPECCGPMNEWCERCHTRREPSPIIGRDKAWSP